MSDLFAFVKAPAAVHMRMMSLIIVVGRRHWLPYCARQGSLPFGGRASKRHCVGRMLEIAGLPFFIVYVMMTFSPAFSVSASIPSGRVKVFPSESVIESLFLFTVVIVPVIASAKAGVEQATARTMMAADMMDDFIFMIAFRIVCATRASRWLTRSALRFQLETG
jgi:hypothetical protein